MSIRDWNMWNWSGPRWTGVGIGIVGIFLVGYFSSFWVALGMFLWSWSINIDNSDL